MADAVQFLFLHLVVPAGRLARLFRAWPPQQSGPGGLADAGLAGVLCLRRLAVRPIAACLDRLQLWRRLSPDRAQAAAPAHGLPCSQPASPAISSRSASSNMRDFSPPPRAAVRSRKVTITTRWSGISSAMRSR